MVKTHIKKLERRTRLIIVASVVAASGFAGLPIDRAFAAGEGLSTVSNKTAQKNVATAINDLQVTGSGNDEVVVSLFVPKGSLTLGSTASVVATGNSTNNLQISGYRNDVNASLLTLSFLSADSGSFKIDVTLGGGDGAVYNPANGHVYKVVPADANDANAKISWTNARTVAENTRYGNNSVPGYLATIATQQEHDFVMQRISGDGWIGASDSAQEGEWRWVAGPEGQESGGAGHLFWNGNHLTGSAAPGQFANWASSEPNNSGTGSGEDCAQLRVSAQGKWNDLPCDSELPFYIVEYGSPSLMPEVVTRQFTVKIAGMKIAAQKDLDVISSSSDGTVGNGQSEIFWAASSDNGRYITFASRATNLVPNDTNNQFDIFVKDRTTGITTRVSTDADGDQANDESYRSAISGNGNYVVFESRATNLVPNDTNGKTDIFRKNLVTGAIDLVSSDSTGTHGNGDSGYRNPASISADGNLVAFASEATNLVLNDTNSNNDIFLKNMTTGAVKRLSVSHAGAQVTGATPTRPKVSANGAFAFFSHSAGLIPEDNTGTADLYRKNLSNDNYSVLTRTDADTIVPGVAISETFSSYDGRYAAFSVTPPLVSSVSDNKNRSYVRDAGAGTTRLASQAITGEDANQEVSTEGISGDGRFVLLRTKATNLGLDYNTSADLFLKDMEKGDVTTLSLTDQNGGASADMKMGASLSGDGSIVVISTAASNFKTTGGSPMASRGQIYVRTIMTDDAPVVEDLVPANENAPQLPSLPEEEGAPNNGNGNEDGKQDADQDNVVSFINETTGKYTTIELDEDCRFSDARSIGESTNQRDADFNYANGLTRFSATCPDGSTQVKIFHHGVSAADLTLRKFNPSTGEYFTISGAAITEQTIDDQVVAVATYTITDNGPLDLNPGVGEITDPAGLASRASSSTSAANQSGLGGAASGILAKTGDPIVAFTIGAALLVLASLVTLPSSKRLFKKINP